MDRDKQCAMLRKVQQMEFVALELNLYLDTHPCDKEALHDYKCAVDLLKKYEHEYICQFGPLLNFGEQPLTADRWQWVEGPWPWEM